MIIPIIEVKANDDAYALCFCCGKKATTTLAFGSAFMGERGNGTHINLCPTCANKLRKELEKLEE